MGYTAIREIYQRLCNQVYPYPPAGRVVATATGRACLSFVPDEIEIFIAKPSPLVPRAPPNGRVTTSPKSNPITLDGHQRSFCRASSITSARCSASTAFAATWAILRAMLFDPGMIARLLVRVMHRFDLLRPVPLRLRSMFRSPMNCRTVIWSAIRTVMLLSNLRTLHHSRSSRVQ